MTDNERRILEIEQRIYDEMQFKLNKNIATTNDKDDYSTVMRLIDEVKQYRSIGTVEEFREAMGRRKPKKVRMSHYGDVRDLGKAQCPNCGLDIHGKGKIGACFRCGQRISWEESDGEDD